MENVLKIVGDISSIIGLIGTGYSVSIWYLLKRKGKQNEQRIKILLNMPTEFFKLPYEIERKYLTRSELLGLLGILPMIKPADRFQLSFLNTADFFVKLKAAQDEKDTTSIEIICYEHEIAQFDLAKIRQQCKVIDIT